MHAITLFKPELLLGRFFLEVLNFQTLSRSELLVDCASASTIEIVVESSELRSVQNERASFREARLRRRRRRQRNQSEQRSVVGSHRRHDTAALSHI